MTSQPVNRYAARIGYEPSQYQTAVFDWIANGQGNAVVEAVAGSGKTTTSVSAAQVMPRARSAIFLAFNKHIAEALTQKLAGTPMTARTIHSAGLGMVAECQAGKRVQVDGRKYAQIAKGLTFQLQRTWEEQQEIQRNLVSLTSKARVTLTDISNRAALDDLCEQYGVTFAHESFRSMVYDLVPKMLTEGERLARELSQVDFDDMIWLPSQWNLTPAAQADWLLIDEAQDLSNAQRDTALRLLAPGGRLMAVGDANQAIMGFAGADADSFARIQRDTNAQMLPLSICYRCPTSHLILARAIVPQIEARPGAPEGLVGDLSENKLAEMIHPGDMVICRLTAPLISQCLRLIGAGVQARVRGRDIGKQLTDIVKAVASMPSYTWEEFGKWLGEHEDAQAQRLAQREGSESAIESLHDRVAAIVAVWEHGEATDAPSLMTGIETLFDDGQPSVLLSTIHRAKGLEAERVFILKPDKLPLIWPKQKPWQAEQEFNLKYVALTRAKQELYWVW